MILRKNKVNKGRFSSKHRKSKNSHQFSNTFLTYLYSASHLLNRSIQDILQQVSAHHFILWSHTSCLVYNQSTHHFQGQPDTEFTSLLRATWRTLLLQQHPHVTKLLCNLTHVKKHRLLKPKCFYHLVEVSNTIFKLSLLNQEKYHYDKFTGKWRTTSYHGAVPAQPSLSSWSLFGLH